MAGDLDFSVQLRLLNENFNQGINQARDKFTDYAQSVKRNVDQMNTDTERATTMLAGLGNVSSDRLTAEIRATADQLRQMGAGANITREQLDSAMQASALQVTRLGRELEVARSEAQRLGNTPATPAQLAEAAAKVNTLGDSVAAARAKVVLLSQTNGTPAQITEAKTKVDTLALSLAEARAEVKTLSQTNASPEDIAEAKAKVEALKNELGSARTEAKALGQTHASPTDIAEAKAAAKRLGDELGEARLAAERLNSTGASPQEVDEAAANVNRLEQELNGARSASVSLSNELAGAMNRASSTTESASNALYRMANIRVPETIRGEINSISRALDDFQRNSGRPAAEIERATRAAQAEIQRLENELNGLDDTQNRVSQGSGGLGGNINRLQGAFGSLQGLLAAAGLGIGVAEIIETADAFKTLEARIKLATGEGAAFTTGFEGVRQIANETFSSVESTGELFARISAAAETMGLAQTEVLSVTQTINEAIKLSGGSAASADAAITQLIQGLQSGVVRGEEFNSIMEQSPRLAKAMADGLGVTRGELRAMAQDGKLTSEVVINAVRSQGEAIASEFATLPTTVGDSLQVLKNQLFNFVGEIDGSLNQTSKLAEAISYIGDNLEDLDPSFIAALTGAFENTIEAVVTVGKRIKEQYDNITEVVNLIAGGSEDAAEQVGLITASLHGVNVFVGAISDGIKGLIITGDLFSGIIITWAAMATRFYASLTFGDGKKAILELAEALDEGAAKAFNRAHEKAMEFESGTEKALLNAAKGAKERFTEMAADSEAAYNVMIAKGEATAEAIEGQLVKMVTDRIRANDMIVSDEDRLLLASKGLQAAISETGDISIESAKQVQAAYLGVGESFAEVALKAQESGKSIELSLTDAIHKANTKEAVDDILLSLQAMANQGLITGQQMEFGANIAKTRYENLDKQLQQNIERFAEYANAELQKTNGATLADIQRAAALEGLSVQATETGGILVMQADKSTLASLRTKEQIDELAGAVGIGLSKEFVKSSASLDELISGFDDLTNAGYDAGAALVNSLTEMSDKARNEVEIEALTARWHELYKEGKITGQELADGLDNVKNRADILKDGINGVTEAYGFLGLKTREELGKDSKAHTDAYNLILEDGKATAQQIDQAFLKTAKSNIAANGGVIDAVTRRMAAERGVIVAIDENGRVTAEKAGQAVSANDQVKTSVDRVITSHRNLASSAGAAGNEMVKSASRAFTAYEKLQQSISVWNAKFAADANTKSESASLAFMQKAEAGIKSKITSLNQLSGSTATADESYQKLMRSMGFVDGFKWSSMADYARDMNRVNAAVDRQAESYSANNMKYRRSNKSDDSSSNNNQNNNQSNNVDNNPVKSVTLNKDNAAQLGFGWDDKTGKSFSNQLTEAIGYAYKIAENNRNVGMDESDVQAKFDRMMASANAQYAQPQPVLPQSVLDSIANLSKTPSFDTGRGGSTKTIDVNFKLGGASASMSMPENQEGALMALLQQLQDSKAIAGY